jgi:hypothetical protein
VPDRGGEGEDTLQDADDHAARRVAVVPFQVKLTLEGVIDGLDDLAQRLEELAAGPCGLALAGRAQQADPGFGDGGLEVAAGAPSPSSSPGPWSSVTEFAASARAASRAGAARAAGRAARSAHHWTQSGSSARTALPSRGR